MPNCVGRAIEAVREARRRGGPRWFKWFFSPRPGEDYAEPEHYGLALTLATRHRQHVFDTLYHALALRLDDAVLVTADQRYERNARAEGRIDRLADFVVST